MNSGSCLQGILAFILEADQQIVVREGDAFAYDAEAGIGIDEFGLVDVLSILRELTDGSEKALQKFVDFHRINCAKSRQQEQSVE